MAVVISTRSNCSWPCRSRAAFGAAAACHLHEPLPSGCQTVWMSPQVEAVTGYRAEEWVGNPGFFERTSCTQTTAATVLEEMRASRDRASARFQPRLPPPRARRRGRVDPRRVDTGARRRRRAGVHPGLLRRHHPAQASRRGPAALPEDRGCSVDSPAASPTTSTTCSPRSPATRRSPSSSSPRGRRAGAAATVREIGRTVRARSPS